MNCIDCKKEWRCIVACDEISKLLDNQDDTMDKVDLLISMIKRELKKADAKYPPMSERVEGLHTLKCEVAELEREIMKKNFCAEDTIKEAVQVAAMAIKFLRDCC